MVRSILFVVLLILFSLASTACESGKNKHTGNFQDVPPKGEKPEGK